MPGWTNLEEILGIKRSINMKDEVRKKVLIDLFASPLTLVPLVAGLTTTIFSWVVGSAPLAAIGFMGALAGIGIFLTRLIFGVDKITENAYKQILHEHESKKTDELEELYSDLKKDKDPRPEECLKELCHLHKELKLKEKELMGREIIDNFESVFESCIAQIKETHVLWQRGRGTTGELKKSLKERRENLVVDVVNKTKQLSGLIQSSSLKMGLNRNESLKEFEQLMLIAKRTEQRLSSIGSETYDAKEFDAY